MAKRATKIAPRGKKRAGGMVRVIEQGKFLYSANFHKILVKPAAAMRQKRFLKSEFFSDVLLKNRRLKNEFFRKSQKNSSAVYLKAIYAKNIDFLFFGVIGFFGGNGYVVDFFVAVVYVLAFFCGERFFD